MAQGCDYESVICVKPEVHVYRIPPRASNRGYRAAEWQLDQPAWSGRLRITARDKKAFIKLEDRTSGELFAQAPVDQFPGIAVESVTDSSRYFVICIEDGTGRRAFIGVGFADRGDAFDFNVALQDHFKWVKQQSEFAKEAQNPAPGPKLDLGFKEGQTIKINIAVIYFYYMLLKSLSLRQIIFLLYFCNVGSVPFHTVLRVGGGYSVNQKAPALPKRLIKQLQEKLRCDADWIFFVLGNLCFFSPLQDLQTGFS
uniref:NECAP endocytosis associated 2 n=1 Tax=Leptobrachium leishanense TaxID=445787 RepID=A0A8C5MFP1_9ANUR